MPRPFKPVAAVVAAILIYAVVRFVLVIYGLEGWATRPPLWDPASHALDGIFFALAFKHFSIHEFLVQLHNSAMWPPVIPLIEAPFQLIFGESYRVARAFTAWMTVPAVLMVFVAGCLTHRRFGVIVGTIAASLLVIAPHVQEYSLLEMLEIPGMFFCALTLFFYLRYLQYRKVRDWQLTCFTGIVLFFCKFNYAIVIMLPIVLCEFFSRREFRAMIGRALWRFARDVNWRGGFSKFVYCYLALLYYIHLRGIHFEAFGRKVYVERVLGNPTYILLGILIARNLIVNRALLADYARNIWNAPEPMRSLLRFDILPGLVWLSYPVFFTTFFIFIGSESTRQKSFWSMETLTFYPGAIVNDYAPTPVIGGLVLGALILGLILFRRLPLVSRFIVGLAAFNLALNILHPNYQTRYLIITIFLVFLAAGVMAVHGLERLLQKKGSRYDRYILWLSPVIAAALVFGFPASRPFLEEKVRIDTGRESVTQVYAAICDEAAKSENNVVIGFSNFIAPASIALQCIQDHPEMRREQMPTTVTRVGFGPEKAVDVIVGSHKVDRFFVMDYSRIDFDVGRLQEPYLIDELKRLLPLDPGYEQAELVDQGQGGYRVWVFRKKALPAS